MSGLPMWAAEALSSGHAGWDRQSAPEGQRQTGSHMSMAAHISWTV